MARTISNCQTAQKALLRKDKFMKTKKVFIKSGKDDIYIEFGYPKRVPAPAIIIAHGLRSYYAGFLNIFAKSLREAGYIYQLNFTSWAQVKVLVSLKTKRQKLCCKITPMCWRMLKNSPR